PTPARKQPRAPAPPREPTPREATISSRPLTIYTPAAMTARSMPWALIGAACLGSFAATSSGTTRAPFLIEMSHDLGVSVALVANLVSFTATAWGVASAIGG